MANLNPYPFISIIIPCFNRANFIEKAIQSALDQDYPNIEIIISDNHSTDGTNAILNKYLDDKRVKYFVNATNIGMIPNFKIATELRAQGDFICYVCSDDYLCNNKFISNSITLINKYPDISFVAAKNCTFYNDTNQLLVDKTDHIFENEFLKGIDVFNNFAEWFAPGWGGILMNRNELIATSVFESKAQSLDYEANLKLMLQGNAAFINEPSYVFRRHSTQASTSMTYEAYINNFDFIENTYSFAKKLNLGIKIDDWREKVYILYLNGIARKLINKKKELEKILLFVKKEKNVKLNFFKFPKHWILLMLYKNYNELSFIIKIFSPSMYQSIETDRRKGE